MKKIFLLLIIIICVGCGANVSNVAIEEPKDLFIHTEEDFNKANKEVLKLFKSFKGCTLNKIWYDIKDRDKELEIMQDNYSDVLVLNINFKTDGNQINLNNYETYNYSITLVKNKPYDNWTILDYGQG